MRNTKSRNNLKTSYQQKFEKLCKNLDINTVYNLMSTQFNTNYLSIPKLVDDKYKVVLKNQNIDVETTARNYIIICSDPKKLREDAAIFFKNDDDQTIMIHPRHNFSFSAANLKLAANSDYNDIQKHGVLMKNNSILMHGLTAGQASGKRDVHGLIPVAKLSGYNDQASPTHLFLDKIERIFDICDRHPRVVIF